MRNCEMQFKKVVGRCTLTTFGFSSENKSKKSSIEILNVKKIE
jgi:hypothetical protein